MNTLVSVVAILACLLVAKWLLQTRSFAFLEGRGGRFGTVDGLRGYLAIAVLFHHFYVIYFWRTTGVWGVPEGTYFDAFGKFGVAVFFVITGFLFTSKLINTRGSVDWGKLFESRVFRIFPLYLFAVLCISWVAFANSGYELVSSPSHLFYEYSRWFFFVGHEINQFPDTGKVIAGVDWTLKYEWLFYLSLPLISVFILRPSKWPALFLLIMSVILFFYPINFSLFSTRFFVLFAVGGLTAYLVKAFPNSAQIMKSKLVSLFVLALVLAGFFPSEILGFGHVVTISLFFILVAMGNDMFGLLRLKASVLLGEISYSIYLLHGLLLYLLFAELPLFTFTDMSLAAYSLLLPVVAVLTVLLSASTFLLIEKPMIALGRRQPIRSARIRAMSSLVKVRRAFVSP